MGYDVIQITYDQIKEKKSFDHIAELTIKRPCFPTSQRPNRSALPKIPYGKELLVDWVELFTAGPAS